MKKGRFPFIYSLLESFTEKGISRDGMERMEEKEKEGVVGEGARERELDIA